MKYTQKEMNEAGWFFGIMGFIAGSIVIGLVIAFFTRFELIDTRYTGEYELRNQAVYDTRRQILIKNNSHYRLMCEYNEKRALFNKEDGYYTFLALTYVNDVCGNSPAETE